MLSHIQTGTNSFDPRIPLSLDFFSFHKKGNGGVDIIVDDEMATLADLCERFPFLRDIPVVNDEGDPLKGELFSNSIQGVYVKGWWKPEEWRGGSIYAARIAR